jgi:hypothetical protein
MMRHSSHNETLGYRASPTHASLRRRAGVTRLHVLSVPGPPAARHEAGAVVGAETVCIFYGNSSSTDWRRAMLAAGQRFLKGALHDLLEFCGHRAAEQPA